VVVVCHDSTLDRTTNQAGPVAARTAAELARVDAGFHFTDARGDNPFRGLGIGVPTLREVLRRFADVPVIIEMKVDRPEMGEAVAAEVAAASAVDRVCAAGDGARAVRAARAALPLMASSACRWDVRFALYRSWIGWSPGRVRYGGYQVPETAGSIRVVSPRFITLAHRDDLEVQVWTVDEEADMQRLLSWGADGLISNRPGLAVSVRDRFMSAVQSAGALRQ